MIDEQQEVARQSRVNPKRFGSYVRGKTRPTNRSDIGDLKTIDSQPRAISLWWKKTRTRLLGLQNTFLLYLLMRRKKKIEKLKLSCHIDNIPCIYRYYWGKCFEKNAIKTDKSQAWTGSIARVLFEVRNEIVAPLTRLFCQLKLPHYHMIGKFVK